MYLISMTLNYQTKILDIAYLLLLKLMKDPKFEPNRNFIDLYIKILIRQAKMDNNVTMYQAALGFIHEKERFYEREFILRLQKEAELNYAMGKLTYNHNGTVNSMFRILNYNRKVKQFSEHLWPDYVKVIRLVLHTFGKENKHEPLEFKRDHFDALLNDEPLFLNNCSTEWAPIDLRGTPL